MAELTVDQFEAFFSALWGENRKPFAWQIALAKRVIGDDDQPWPEAIQLPTASGKTACIDIAVFALAAQAARLGTRKKLSAPRRIFFVVDRRVIVDEAFERARMIAQKLKNPDQPILKTVAEQLKYLSNSDTPLAAFQLRGGMYRSNAWAKSPAQPMIVASTVDQLGSRLLFRAYGPGSGTWPIHAGLVGNDALILLDEAHCAQPFLETLLAVKKYRHWGETDFLPPFHVSVMSATPPPGMTDSFKDESTEPQDPDHPLGARQLAIKTVELVAPVSHKIDEYVSKMAKALSDSAQKLAEQPPKGLLGKPAVVVFCNRVAVARETRHLLAEKSNSKVILLTGRMRPLDKDQTVLEELKLLSADYSQSRTLEQNTFVVATQTLEVGANLDFDLLVSECASLDALRQRFGRLNRMGRKFAAKASILISAEQAKKGYQDPVYGSALTETWAWLQDQENELDMGIAALSVRLPQEPGELEILLQRLNSPTTHAPIMLPAHVDSWAQTSPIPLPSPDVSIFLHGPGQRSADVLVCWRSDILLDQANPATEVDETADSAAWLDVLALVPPSSSECLAVPIYVMRRWLSGQDQPIVEQSDLEGDIVQSSDEKASAKRRVIRWRGPDKSKVISASDTILPGDVLVITANETNWHLLGDFYLTPSSKPILDWGDRANAQMRAKAVLRLHPETIAQWGLLESQALKDLVNTLHDASSRYDEDGETLLIDVIDCLKEIAKTEGISDWLKQIIHHLAQNRCQLIPHPQQGLIILSNRPMPRINQADEPDYFSDETDAASSGTSQKQNLYTHLAGVAKWARDFAEKCGLPSEIADCLVLAANGHDLGKIDPRFQAWLRGGVALTIAEPLAKSPAMPQSKQASEAARKRADYPKGGRHELLSVRLIESQLSLLPENALYRDLVLHLVESHHGYCRPFAPVVFDDKVPDVEISEWLGQRLTHQGPTKLERLDSGVAERYWRLTRHFGWWGLAWLETILRLADHRRSEEEESL